MVDVVVWLCHGNDSDGKIFAKSLLKKKTRAARVRTYTQKIDSRELCAVLVGPFFQRDSARIGAILLNVRGRHGLDEVGTHSQGDQRRGAKFGVSFVL